MIILHVHHTSFGSSWVNKYALKIRTSFPVTMLMWPFIVLRIKKKNPDLKIFTESFIGKIIELFHKVKDKF